jgi:hypothetical protein
MTVTVLYSLIELGVMKYGLARNGRFQGARTKTTVGRDKYAR